MIQPPWEDAVQSPISQREGIDSSRRVDGSTCDFINKKSKINPKLALIAMSSMLLLGVLSTGSMLYEYFHPLSLLNLNQMDKREGVITRVYYSGRTKAPYFELRTNNGELVEYYSLRDFQDEFEKLVNQPVIVWSQKNYLFFGLVFDIDNVRQVQHGNALTLDYVNDYKQMLKRGAQSGRALHFVAAMFFLIVLIIPSIFYLFKCIVMLGENKGVNNDYS